MSRTLLELLRDMNILLAKYCENDYPAARRFGQNQILPYLMQGSIMEEKFEGLKGEIDDLKQELGQFQQEKERVRAVIGSIGGVPKFRTKLVNAMFIIVLVSSVIISIIGGDRIRLLMIEVATVTLSIKIIYLIHCQMRINHFKFWMLSSIELRINELMIQIREMREENKS